MVICYQFFSCYVSVDDKKITLFMTMSLERFKGPIHRLSLHHAKHVLFYH